MVQTKKCFSSNSNIIVNNLILGVTGNIASGKSTVAAALERKGAVVVDADQLAREVVAPGTEVQRQLVESFGTEIFRADGALDRERLGGLVFTDARARAELNRIIHPAIARCSVERLQTLKRTAGIPLVVYESPLLFEAGAEERVDRVLVVCVDEQVQLQRLIERDGLDPAAARQRIAAQLPQAEKRARADYVIDTSGSMEETLQQVDRLWVELRKIGPD